MSQRTTCTHCSDTDDHVHLDSFDHARTRRRQLLRLVLVRAVIVAAVLLGGASGLIFAALDLGAVPPAIGFAVGVGAGLVLWAMSTGVGVLTSTLVLARLGPLRALMIGALVAAGLVPVLAAGFSWVQPVDWLIAAGTAAGYLAGTYGAESVRLWRLRTLLGQDTRAGEVARDSAAITYAQDQDVADLLASAGVAVLVGCYVWGTGMLTVLVVVLVPLHVAVVAAGRRRAVRQQRRKPVPVPQRAAS